MEEPLHRGDRAGMRRLREMAHVRVAGGEMTSKLYEFRDLIAEDALTFCSRMRRWSVQVPGCVGLMAQEHNLVFTPHTWTSGVGVVANAHLTAGIADAPFVEFPYDPPEWDVDRRDYMMANN